MVIMMVEEITAVDGSNLQKFEWKRVIIGGKEKKVQSFDLKDELINVKAKNGWIVLPNSEFVKIINNGRSVGDLTIRQIERFIETGVRTR